MGNNKMKIFRRLCVVVCLLNTYGLTVSAQSVVNKPFLQEGKEWYTRCVHYFLGEFFHTERIEGDTILDGVAYKKLYDGNVVEGFLREENGKVLGKVGSYYDDYDTSDWSSHLVYDFSLGKGDTTVSHDYFRLNVNTVDTILVDGEPYRRLGIGFYSYSGGGTDYSKGNIREYWVEGIGSDVGPDPGPGFDWVTSSYMTFDSCKVDGKLLFTSNDFCVFRIAIANGFVPTIGKRITGRPMNCIF